LRLGDGKRSLNGGDWEVYAMVFKKKNKNYEKT